MQTWDLRPILVAVEFASIAHGDQKRKTGEPYIHHPIAVANHVTLMCHDDPAVTTVVAAVLHDVVEDTKVKLPEIEQNFGAVVASLVKELTNDKSMSQHDRKQQMIAKAKHLSPAARVIKLADRYHNLTTAKGCGVQFVERYCTESRALLGNLAAVSRGESFDRYINLAYEEVEKLEQWLRTERKPS